MRIKKVDEEMKKYGKKLKEKLEVIKYEGKKEKNKEKKKKEKNLEKEVKEWWRI